MDESKLARDPTEQAQPVAHLRRIMLAALQGTPTRSSPYLKPYTVALIDGTIVVHPDIAAEWGALVERTRAAVEKRTAAPAMIHASVGLGLGSGSRGVGPGDLPPGFHRELDAREREATEAQMMLARVADAPLGRRAVLPRVERHEGDVRRHAAPATAVSTFLERGGTAGALRGSWALASAGPRKTRRLGVSGSGGGRSSHDTAGMP